MFYKQWDFLKSKFESDQLSHAYLLSGRDLDSINLFAKEFIKLINCQSYKINDRHKCKTNEESSDMCQNCKMIDRGSFPDLMSVKSKNSRSSLENEKDMMSIEIEQIREVQNFLSYKSYYGCFKTVVVENAERMTLEAQNCFLKNLEEPKGKTIIFLISSKSEILLPTIFSRCQEIKFLAGQSDFEENKEIPADLLEIINLDLAEKFRYTKAINFEGDNFNKILNGLQRYFRNLLLAKVGIIEGGKNNYSIEKLKKIIRLIGDISRQSDIANINNRLALEVILLEL